MIGPSVLASCQETAQSLYAALARGDADAVRELLHPQFAGHVTEAMPCGLGGTYDGPDAMLGFWWRLGSIFRAEAQPDELRLLDDGRLHVSGWYRGSSRAARLPLEAAYVHVLTFRDGRIAGLDQLTDSRAWELALGEKGPLETIDYAVRDGVAHVRLNRPDAHNAINLQMAEDTLTVAQRIQADPEVRSVLIAGNGPSLTVGGDITYFTETAEPGTYGQLFARMTRPFHEGFRILSRVEVPIVTAVRGNVAGGGLGYVYAADICVAAENARFTTAFSHLGLSGDGGGTWHLPRLVGERRAALMYLTNRSLDAQEALDWGLVTEVVPTDDLDERAAALAAQLASGPTLAFSRMRRLLRQSSTTELDVQLVDETEYVAETGGSRDASDAIAAFLEKRRPKFEGR
jgi:2-(1,2-epoxy-1,2-dihydrophenyl)acetyl-CoA isomerase